MDCPLPIDKFPPVTRPQIELCIKVFIVLLALTFVWAVSKVLGMIGVFG